MKKFRKGSGATGTAVIDESVRVAPSLRRVGQLAEPFISDVCSRHGFTEIRILRDWQWIVGKEIATRCHPQSIATGRNGRRVLFVHAQGAAATAVLHQTDLLLERIATACGYRAIDLIRVTQVGEGSVQPVGRASPEPPVEEPALAPEAVDLAVANVRNDALRAALTRLGNAIRRPYISGIRPPDPVTEPKP